MDVRTCCPSPTAPGPPNDTEYSSPPIATPEGNEEFCTGRCLAS